MDSLGTSRVESLRFGGTNVEDFEGLRQEHSKLEFKADGCGWDVEHFTYSGRAQRGVSGLLAGAEGEIGNCFGAVFSR